MNIYIDGMGGDNAPCEIIKGCISAIEQYGKKLTIIGNENLIKNELTKYNYNTNLIDIIHATETIDNNEEPAKAIRTKNDSSIVIGLEKLKEDKNSAFISAGSTGALLAGGLLKVGRIKGIQRPAISVLLPTDKGFSLMLDGGANVDCKPVYLQQFAIMASIYAENILGIQNPKVGLINIGSEEKKGNELTKETYKLLKETQINFIGNIEPREIPYGEADILICDGFTGNIVLKLMEGMGLYIFDGLKESIMSSTISKLGGFLLKPAIRKFRKRFDYSEYGGAPLLGVKGGIIKAHGSSDAKAIKNAINQGIKLVEKNISSQISNKIEEIKE